MYTLEQILETLRRNKPELQKRYPIAELCIFGSYARGDATAESDLDVLVGFDGNIGLGFIELACDLEDVLKIKVDLVSIKAIQPKYWPYVEKDLIYV